MASEDDDEDDDDDDESASPEGKESAGKKDGNDGQGSRSPSSDEEELSDEEDEEEEEEEGPVVAAAAAAQKPRSGDHEVSSSDDAPASPSQSKCGGRKRMRTTESGEDQRVSHQQRWDEMFERLKEFKHKHGHCRVPNRYSEDTQLGSWVSAQRRQYRIVTQGGQGSAALTTERANQLIGIGFEWSTSNPHHTPWDTRFQALLDFVRRFGHAEVPMRWAEDPKLSHWVSKQRHDYKLKQEGKTSRLSDDKLRLLNSVGFQWEGSRRSVTKKVQEMNVGGDTNMQMPGDPTSAQQVVGAAGTATMGVQANSMSLPSAQPQPMNDPTQQFLTQLITQSAAQGSGTSVADASNTTQHLQNALSAGGLQMTGGVNFPNAEQLLPLLSLLSSSSPQPPGIVTTNVPPQAPAPPAPLQQLLAALVAALPQAVAASQPAFQATQTQAAPQPAIPSGQPQPAPFPSFPAAQPAPLPIFPTAFLQSALSAAPQPTFQPAPQPQPVFQAAPQQQGVDFLQQVLSLLGNRLPTTHVGTTVNYGGAPNQPVAIPNVAQQVVSLLPPIPQQTSTPATSLQSIIQQAYQPQATVVPINSQAPSWARQLPVQTVSVLAQPGSQPQYVLVVPLNALNGFSMPTALAMNSGVPFTPQVASTTTETAELPNAAVMNNSAGPNPSVVLNTTQTVLQPLGGISYVPPGVTNQNQTALQPTAMTSGIATNTVIAQSMNNTIETVHRPITDPSVSSNMNEPNQQPNMLQQASPLDSQNTTNSSGDPANALVLEQRSISGSSIVRAGQSGPDEFDTSVARGSSIDESGSDQNSAASSRPTTEV